MGKRAKRVCGPSLGIWTELKLEARDGLTWFELRCGPFRFDGAVTERVAMCAYRWLHAHFARGGANVVDLAEQRDRAH